MSGLAKEIDAAAHTTAIEVGGKTIAVVGTPLSESYPKENTALQARILQDFLCISQFEKGQPVQPKNLPIRNRIMTLISDVTVIMKDAVIGGQDITRRRLQTRLIP